ncbi:hypothetical protein pb186bvf_008548 [Paramecium bursaria]
MKLPSIPQKPSSAQSNRQGKSNVMNLEKNLMAKFNEYDNQFRSEEIAFAKKSVQENPYKKLQSQELEKEKIIEPYKPLQNKSLRPIKQSEPEIKQIVQTPQFITQNIENDSSSDDSIEEIIRKSEDISKQKKLINNYDNDLGELNKMIDETQDELNQQTRSTQGIMNLLKKLDIDQSLMKNIQKQFKDILEIDREQQAVDEYYIQEHKRKTKTPSIRSESMQPKKR